MSTFRVSLLGRFHIETDSRVQVDISSRKARELLCYLIIHRNYPQLREKVAETLWEENPKGQSKCYLRRTLWQLQQAIEAEVKISHPLLIVEPDWIQFNPKAQLWLDVRVLERAYRQVRDMPGEELDFSSVRMMEEATRLYCGSLLEDCYQTWCIFERERLQHIYLVMLDKLMRYYESQGNPEAGIAYGYEILHCDRARESTHRQLMRLYYMARDRSGAIRQYERCQLALREELDVEPTQQTQQLYQHIRQGTLGQSFPLRRDSDRAQFLQLITELEQMQRGVTHLNQSVTSASALVRGLLE